MLELENLCAFHGRSQVLHGVTLRVAPGEIVALLGRNGCGRSTTLKAIMGLVRGQGTVRWRGKNLLGLRPSAIARRGIGYVPEGRDIFPRLTVQQNLRLGEQPHRAPGRWRLDDMYALFPALAARRHTEAGVLSGGEQQMLALCRTLMGNPDLVLVDEPTEGLASRIVAQVADFLRTLQRQGIGVLLVEQKLAIALEVSQRCCLMGHGRIVFEGPPDALAAEPALRREWLEV